MGERSPAASDWELELAIAEYDIRAVFGDGQPPRAGRVLVRPPYQEVRL